MLKRLYDKTIAYASSPNAPWALGIISFAESSFFPIPPDVMLVPMAMAKPQRAWFYASICTVCSVIGGLFGYAIGYLLYDSVGQWLVQLYGYADKMEQFRALYQEWGHWIILIKGMTPIPYKLVTIASGLAGYSLFWFVVLSAITRGLRFFIVAGLLHHFGDTIRVFIERNLTLVAAIVIGGIVGGFAIIKLLM